jgi:hypothetical protein
VHDHELPNDKARLNLRKLRETWTDYADLKRRLYQVRRQIKAAATSGMSWHALACFALPINLALREGHMQWLCSTSLSSQS